jgi:AAA15 family ATPase/GTPase
MQNAITTLRIQNFKSIKDVTMQPRRVNIIIGEPNVGKSNILEALSLLGGNWSGPVNKFMGYVLRYNDLRQLFYDNLPYAPIFVETNNDVLLFGSEDGYEPVYNYLLLPKNNFDEIINSNNFERIGNLNSPKLSKVLKFFPSWYTMKSKKDKEPPSYWQTQLNGSGRITDENKYSFHGVGGYGITQPIRYYSFLKNVSHDGGVATKSLRSPNGDNLIAVIQTHPELRKEIAGFFSHYGLRFSIRMDDRRIEVVKDLDGITYSYPYTSTADTLQRLIFHLAAIASNDDAVLLFEEPEAHSFPSYIMHLAQSIVESRNNQFFIVTHSPYLITEILEEMLLDDELRPELAMFAAYYEDYQTKVYQLTEEDILNIRRDGLDVFLNMGRFVPEQ